MSITVPTVTRDPRDPTAVVVGRVRITGVPPSEPGWWVGRCIDCDARTHDRLRGPVVAFAQAHRCDDDQEASA